MSLYIAVLVVGQVAADGQFNSPPVAADPPPPVTLSDRSLELAPPANPTTENPRRVSPRPVATASLADEPPATLSPPAEPELPPTGRVTTQQRSAAPPPPTPANSEALQVAATIVEQLLSLDETASQAVRRVRLAEALAQLGDPTLQAAAVRAYWGLAQAIADAQYSTDIARMLAEVGRPAAEVDQALLQEALSAAEADEAAAHDALLAAQYGLLRSTGLATDGALPWPADAPLVAPYRTQFESLFANRAAPLNLRQIHQSLPGKLSLIERRVVAVDAAESATEAVLESYRSQRSTLPQVLDTVARLDRARRNFLASVVDYNLQIADYSLAVVGPRVGTETLVATMIKTVSQASNLVAIPNANAQNVRPASAVVPTNDNGLRR